MNLFKFATVDEFTEELLKQGQVFCQAPKNLNDPFECSPEFTFNGTDEDFVEWLTDQKLLIDGGQRETVKREMQEHFIKEKVFLPVKLDMIRKDSYERLANEIGIYCLSERYDSLLMWAHYAEKHQGFCVEFEAGSEVPFFGTAQKVEYSDTYPSVDFFNTPNEHQVGPIFLTKSTDWKYENEWRIIDHENGSGLRKYPKELMKSVTFGLRMAQENKDKIFDWIKDRGTNVTVYEAYRHRTEFRVNRREVNA